MKLFFIDIIGKETSILSYRIFRDPDAADKTVKLYENIFQCVSSHLLFGISDAKMHIRPYYTEADDPRVIVCNDRDVRVQDTVSGWDIALSRIFTR